MRDRLAPDYAPAGAEHPGEFPYTRGISAEPKPWIMGQYAGFGTPAESNAAVPRAAGRRASPASRSRWTCRPRLGLDSDDPRAAGEVGRVGVAIDSLADIEILMDGIPLEKITQVRTTANSIGYLWAALFIALAERRGRRPERVRAVHPERRAQGVHRARHPDLPAGPVAASGGGHHRVLRRGTRRAGCRWRCAATTSAESGGDAAQEIGFTFANAIAYLDEAVRRGVGIDQVAPTLFTFLSITMDFLPEVAKFRAARRVWAGLMRERYGAADPRSEQLRIFAFTAGSSFTAQQPLNNVVRATIEAHRRGRSPACRPCTCRAYDEALGVPTEAAATLALRTQQIVAYETGAHRDRRPARWLVRDRGAHGRRSSGASSRCWTTCRRRGGALRCIESGYLQGELAESAWRHTRAVESGSRTVVGVNRFAGPPGATSGLEVFTVNPDAEAAQVAAVRAVRKGRDPEAVATAVSDVEDAARAGDNVVPACVAAVTVSATVGEVVGALRRVHGSWRPGP